MDEEIIVLFGFIEDKEKQAEDFLESKEGSEEENERSILILKTVEHLLQRLSTASNINELELSIRNELDQETKPFRISSLNRELELLSEYQQQKDQKSLSAS